jgi:hypothetical protein
MPRRKKTTEANYTVKKGRDNTGSMDVEDTTVNAANSAEALDIAMKNDSDTDSYDNIEVTKDQGSGAVKTKSRTISKVEPKTQGMMGLESIVYPYHIGLPMGFQPLFDSLTKKIKESLKINTRYGRLHIQVSDKQDMERFVNEVTKRSNGKTTVKSMANIVMNGINESVKK